MEAVERPPDLQFAGLSIWILANMQRGLSCLLTFENYWVSARVKGSGHLNRMMLRQFCTAVDNLYNSLEGDASLLTFFGDGFSLELTGDGKGHILALTELFNGEDHLKVHLTTDQTQLLRLRNQLFNLVARFPATELDELEYNRLF